VTASELVLYLAALDEAGGAMPGDRIEHGADIPAGLIPDIAALGLTIITQAAFIHDRGDRYLTEVEVHAQADLWRLASLAQAGAKIAGGSDAPYGSYDPWLAMRSAMHRQTSSGHTLGKAEALPAMTALNLYLGSLETPSEPRQITVGAAAEFCLLQGSLMDCLSDPHHSAVRATIIGEQIYPSSSTI
jgi:predicted amidohydrolase YtcJ